MRNGRPFRSKTKYTGNDLLFICFCGCRGQCHIPTPFSKPKQPQLPIGFAQDNGKHKDSNGGSHPNKKNEIDHTKEVCVRVCMYGEGSESEGVFLWMMVWFDGWFYCESNRTRSISLWIKKCVNRISVFEACMMRAPISLGDVAKQKSSTLHCLDRSTRSIF